MATPLPGVYADEQAFLDSVEGEVSFFRSIMRARPVGKHRHFHILTVRNAISKDTGRILHVESIWEKLRRCYNLDALEAIEREAENYNSPKSEVVGINNNNNNTTAIPHATSSNATPACLRSPSPSENLTSHPFFREEFSLPYEDFEALIAPRRMRETASLPSSPAPTSPGMVDGAASATPTRRATTTPVQGGSASRVGKRKLTKSKLNLAGLVGGDSDSSALTQESGDEGGEDEGSGIAETPKESVVTGTGTDADGRTEDGDEEDVEMRDASVIESPKPTTRGRATKASTERGRRGRGAANTRGSTARGKKKQKR